ncbi:uncharacterized protein BJ171DRAFT_498687 [Polychytrium aggregatum]|uniref:uncharacterized protein n=1 Tax=Polychytrium aggregatum TaxID=110093 RepID=UPI0022FE5208|nr:uncharacterized protein BJ171DRAFT_498687 [Polychytrium aggregatum]KAI9206102.1 hypothetical protein BJ171DRAFT_498687 [Polychytrium aggregatum]
MLFHHKQSYFIPSDYKPHSRTHDRVAGFDDWLAETREYGRDYEAMLQQGQSPVFYWVATSSRAIPPSAIPVGRTADGRPLYCGRTFHETGVHLGWVTADAPEGLHYSYAEREFFETEFEVLVGDLSRLLWIEQSGAAKIPIQQFQIEGGSEANGTAQYVAIAEHAGGVYAGKAIAGDSKGCLIGFDTKEVAVAKYRVLVRK